MKQRRIACTLGLNADIDRSKLSARAPDRVWLSVRIDSHTVLVMLQVPKTGSAEIEG